MLKKKVIFSLTTVSMLAAILLISKIGLGATTQPKDELSLKKNQILENQLKGKPIDKYRKPIDNTKTQIPVPEPDAYKNPHQWKSEGQWERHGVIRTANTIWTIKGILEPNQEVWDELVAWSGPDKNNIQSIGTFTQPTNLEYTATYKCPNQNIGKIYITDVKGDILYFKSDSGVTGNFNLDSHDWNFDK